MSFFQLPIETGIAQSDEGETVTWVACPDLPGAYEEDPDAGAALEKLRDLARRILAEHLVREDPLDAAITERATPPDSLPPDTLLVTVSEADLTAAREAPLLIIEAPEP